MIRLKRFYACLLAVLLLGAQLLVPVSAEDVQQMPVATAPYYGRWAISVMPNSQKLLYVYDQLVAGIEASAAEISVYNGTDKISEEELKMVYDAYRRDHTEHFWLGNTYGINVSSANGILSVKPTYIFAGEALAQAKQAFATAASTYLSFLNEEMSDFEKELILHDRLAANVSYVTTANAHNAYGALVEGKAVCEGYAEAFQYLCQCAGIQSFIATGDSYNPATQEKEAHAWNFVKIDGEFYQVDLTWNDQGETLYHAYFNVTQKQILRDHIIDATAYPLPSCTATAANYFEVKGGALNASGCTVARVAELFRANGSPVHVFIKDDATAFLNWYQQNIEQLISELQLTGSISYGYAQLGSELVLTLQSASCPHTALTRIGPASASCTKDGNLEYFLCSCGKWFADGEGRSEITDKSTVIIKAQGHSWTEKVENAERLRKRGEDCQSHDTYWYGCAACDEVSQSIYFEASQAGPHIYGEHFETDGTSHFMECSVCHGEKDRTPHEDTDGDGRCDTCLFLLSGQEQGSGGGDQELSPEGGSEENGNEQSTEDGTAETETSPTVADGSVGDISELIDLLMENPTYLAIGGGCVFVIFLLILVAAFRRR